MIIRSLCRYLCPALAFSLFVVAITHAQTCQPSSGCLDTSFNGTGKQVIPLSGRSHNSSGLVQPDGKIVWLGDNNTTGATMIRLNTDGSLDTTFGSGGVVYTNWYVAVPLTFPRGYPYDIAIQNIAGVDYLVVVGSWTVPGTKKNTYTNSLRVDRFLLSNGARDTSFGTNGTLVINNPYALAVDIDYAGRIVAVGDSGGVTRLLANGSIDTTFGPNGAGVTGAGGAMWDVKALADGSLVFAGSCASGRDTIMCVTRLKENGAVDGSFGTGGQSFANFYGSGSFSRAFAMDIDAAGNIVAAGTARGATSRGTTPPDYFAAARFTSTGQPDTAFHGNGKVLSSVSGLAKSVYSVPAGGIVMSAAANGPSNSDFFLTSYTSTGILDTTFGNNGLIFTDISGGDYSQKSQIWTDPACSCTKLVVFGGADPDGAGARFARYILR
jgi:uncharacterized delta-60 repeat protein